MAAKDLEQRLKALEDNVRNLQDIEEIKNLQKIYGYYLERWQWDQVIELFSDTPDTSAEINDSGVFIGKEHIKRYFYRENVPPDFLHVLMQVNEVVHVDPSGKTAKGRWYGFGVQAIPSPNDGKVIPILSSGIYENDYVKEGGKWKFKKLLWSRIFWCPYEDGWVKTPVAIIPGRKKAVPDLPTTTYKPYPSGYLFPYHFKNPITGK